MSDTSKLSSLGSGKTVYRYDNPTKDTLEIFDNQHPASPHVVGLECTEFTSLCPMTGQPDFGVIHIAYIPNKSCVESKSLKLYLGSYRNHGSFHEDCVNQIAHDIFERIQPQYLRVFGNFNVRGGIAIKPLALTIAPELSAEQRALCAELLANYDRLKHPQTV